MALTSGACKACYIRPANLKGALLFVSRVRVAELLGSSSCTQLEALPTGDFLSIKFLAKLLGGGQAIDAMSAGQVRFLRSHKISASEIPPNIIRFHWHVFVFGKLERRRKPTSTPRRGAEGIVLISCSRTNCDNLAFLPFAAASRPKVTAGIL